MGRPKGSLNEKKDNLKAFAIRIEREVLAANLKDCESLERLICRILTRPEKNPAVAAMMASKWVEWKYGKSVQPISGEDGGPLQVQIITNASFPTP